MCECLISGHVGMRLRQALERLCSAPTAGHGVEPIWSCLAQRRPALQYATLENFASSQDAQQADPDHRTYRSCHRRDCTARTPELIYRCYHLQAAPLSVMTTGRMEQAEDGPRRRWDPRDSQESAVRRMEQLPEVGGSCRRNATLPHQLHAGFTARYCCYFDGSLLHKVLLQHSRPIHGVLAVAQDES